MSNLNIRDLRAICRENRKKHPDLRYTGKGVTKASILRQLKAYGLLPAEESQKDNSEHGTEEKNGGSTVGTVDASSKEVLPTSEEPIVLPNDVAVPPVPEDRELLDVSQAQLPFEQEDSADTADTGRSLAGLRNSEPSAEAFITRHPYLQARAESASPNVDGPVLEDGGFVDGGSKSRKSPRRMRPNETYVTETLLPGDLNEKRQAPVDNTPRTIINLPMKQVSDRDAGSLASEAEVRTSGGDLLLPELRDGEGDLETVSTTLADQVELPIISENSTSADGEPNIDLNLPNSEEEEVPDSGKNNEPIVEESTHETIDKPRANDSIIKSKDWLVYSNYEPSLLVPRYDYESMESLLSDFTTKSYSEWLRISNQTHDVITAEIDRNVQLYNRRGGKTYPCLLSASRTERGRRLLMRILPLMIRFDHPYIDQAEFWGFTGDGNDVSVHLATKSGSVPYLADLTHDVALLFSYQLLSALSCLHSRGVVHGSVVLSSLKRIGTHRCVLTFSGNSKSLVTPGNSTHSPMSRLLDLRAAGLVVYQLLTNESYGEKHPSLAGLVGSAPTQNRNLQVSKMLEKLGKAEEWLLMALLFPSEEIGAYELCQSAIFASVRESDAEYPLLRGSAYLNVRDRVELGLPTASIANLSIFTQFLYDLDRNVSSRGSQPHSGSTQRGAFVIDLAYEIFKAAYRSLPAVQEGHSEDLFLIGCACYTLASQLSLDTPPATSAVVQAANRILSRKVSRERASGPPKLTEKALVVMWREILIDCNADVELSSISAYRASQKEPATSTFIALLFALKIHGHKLGNVAELSVPRRENTKWNAKLLNMEKKSRRLHQLHIGEQYALLYTLERAIRQMHERVPMSMTITAELSFYKNEAVALVRSILSSYKSPDRSALLHHIDAALSANTLTSLLRLFVGM